MPRPLRHLQRLVLRFLSALDGLFNRWYGQPFNPLYQSGTIVIALYLVLVATGLWLVVFYRVGAPWESVAALTAQRWTGNWQGSYQGWLPTPRILGRRLPRTLPGLKRFYMAGHWVELGGGQDQVAQVVVVRVLAGAARGLDDDRRVDRGRRLEHGEALLHVEIQAALISEIGIHACLTSIRWSSAAQGSVA